MKTNFYKAVLLTVFSMVLIMMQTSLCPAQRAGGTGGNLKNAVQDKAATYTGRLEVGKTDSAIVYVGAESGDVAAYCFANKSQVGRAILAACKKGEQCEVTGEVDMEAGCKIKDERELSAHGKITLIKSVKSKSKISVKGSAGGAKG